MIFHRNKRPLRFAFPKSIPDDEKNPVIKAIEANGGKVIDFDVRDAYTVVLVHKFKLSYVKDCLEAKQLLPLNAYRIDTTQSTSLQTEGSIFKNKTQKSACQHVEEKVMEIDLKAKDDLVNAEETFQEEEIRNSGKFLRGAEPQNCEICFSAKYQMIEMKKFLEEKKQNAMDITYITNQPTSKSKSKQKIRCEHAHKERSSSSSAKEQIIVIKKLLQGKKQKVGKDTCNQRTNKSWSKTAIRAKSENEVEATADKKRSKEAIMVPNPLFRGKKRAIKASSSKSTEAMEMIDDIPGSHLIKSQVATSTTDDRIQNTEESDTTKKSKSLKKSKNRKSILWSSSSDSDSKCDSPSDTPRVSHVTRLKSTSPSTEGSIIDVLNSSIIDVLNSSIIDVLNSSIECDTKRQKIVESTMETNPDTTPESPSKYTSPSSSKTPELKSLEFARSVADAQERKRLELERKRMYLHLQ